eukprot:scaffold43088_cov64-Phaeocystis_antarctica.AAC.2
MAWAPAIACGGSGRAYWRCAGAVAAVKRGETIGGARPKPLLGGQTSGSGSSTRTSSHTMKQSSGSQLDSGGSSTAYAVAIDVIRRSGGCDRKHLRRSLIAKGRGGGY